MMVVRIRMLMVPVTGVQSGCGGLYIGGVSRMGEILKEMMNPVRSGGGEKENKKTNNA